MGLKRLLVFLIVIFTALLILNSVFSVAENKLVLSAKKSRFFFELANGLLKKGSSDGAINYFKKSLELEPDFAPAFHNLAVAYYSKSDNANAINFLEKAIDARKDYSKAHYNIALLYREMHDLNKAIEHLSLAAELEPKNANANFDLGVLYVERFRLKESLGQIEVGDLSDLYAAKVQYLKAFSLNPKLEAAKSNAEILENVIGYYWGK